MSTHRIIRTSPVEPGRVIFSRLARLCLILLFLVSLLGIQTAPVEAAAGWTAFNDCAVGSGASNPANTTTIAGRTGSGTLKNFSTGANLGITATFTSSGSPTDGSTSGALANAGTDAANLFDGKADMVGVVNYGSSSGWYIDLTLTGLNPNKTYSFATSANRADSGYTTRNTTYILSGDDGATNASSANVTVVNDHTIAFTTGYNTVNGYIARWTGIRSGSDGTIAIRARPSTTAEISGSDSYRAYGFSVFMLAQEPDDSPEIVVRGGMDPFLTTPGRPSATQTYTVSGQHLTEPILITAPNGFQVSEDGTGFGSSVSITPTGGVIPETEVAVRLSGVVEGELSGQITHTSSGADPVNLAVSGNVTNTVCTTTSLTAVEDNYLSANATSVNNGGNTSVHVDGTTGTSRRVALLRWNTDSLPAEATISAASLSVYVTDVSPLVFNLYNMRRDWVEGASNGSGTADGSTWDTYDGVSGHTWGAAGAADTSTDRYNTNLWSAGTSSFTTANTSATVALNADGVAVIQSWKDGSLPNYGLTMQYASGSASNALFFSSSEATTAANRPRLNLTYCSPITPKVAITGALSAFSTFPGSPSTSQAYTVEGTFLKGDILVTAPEGFQLSLDDLNYSSSINLIADDSGTVALTTIYVRLSGMVEGSFSGNITHTSPEASELSLAVSGTVSNCLTVALIPDADTYLSGYNTSNNYGASETLKTTNNPQNPRASLFRWDLDSIPGNATISAASFSLNVSTASTQVYNLYNLRRAWVEGAGSGSQTGDGATWQTYDGIAGHSWGADGAADTTLDRFAENLWNETTSSFASTGIQTVALNETGIATLQDWILHPETNFGVTMQNFVGAGSVSDDFQFSSAENTTVANRPRLNLTYCINTTDPNIHTTLSALTFSSPVNQPSVAKGYTVSGVNLIEPVQINASGNFEISTNGSSDFGPTLSLTPVDGAVSANIYARMKALPVGTYTGTITHTSGEATPRVIQLSGVSVNTPPQAPGLIQPADLATGVSVPAGLDVSVADPDADTMDVNFYGRATGTEPAHDFTIVLLPDIQNESQYNVSMLTSQMNWIVGKHTEENIVFVTSLGDLVNTDTSDDQYRNADSGFDILDAGGVPYSVGPGNHDMMSGTNSKYNTYFGPNRFAGKPWYQGTYNNSSTDNTNNYSFFSASGNDFILINLQYNAGPAQIEWADGLLKANPDRRGIVEQHDILNTNDTWANTASYDGLRDNPNLFLMVCGHMHSTGDGAAYVQGTGTDNHVIHVVMADYQDFSNGNGWLRLLKFSPAHDKIYMTTYSAVTGETIVTSPDKMDLDYDLNEGSGGPFSLIGVDEDVASGSAASTLWQGLAPLTSYDWFASASDGSSVNTSPTWSFTTTDGPSNNPPVITEGTAAPLIVNEDTPGGLTLHVTDLDPDETFTWSIGGAALNGTASLVPNGAEVDVSYAPNENFFGTDHFSVGVADSHGGTDVITINVSVNAINDPPVCAARSINTVEDTPGEVAASCSDIDSPTLTYHIATTPTQGVATVNGNQLRFTPLENHNGPDQFTYQAFDGFIYSQPATVSVTIQAVNDPPVAVNDSYSVNNTETLSVDAAHGVLANDTDVEGDPLSAVLVDNPQHGTLSLEEDGSFSFIPVTDYSGPDAFTYYTTEPNADSQIATVSITILSGTTPLPYPSSFYGDMRFVAGEPELETGIDAYVTGVTNPVSSTQVAMYDGHKGYTINVIGDDPGTTVKDGGVENDLVTFKIGNRIVATGRWHTGTNVRVDFHPPQALPESGLIGNVDLPVSFTGAAQDQASDVATFHWDWNNDGIYEASGAVQSHTWTSAGDHTIRVKAIDAQGGEGEATEIVSINSAPVLDHIPDQTVNEGVLLNFTAHATDPQSDPLTFSLRGTIPSGASITTGGIFNWTPDEAQGPLDYTFEVCVKDVLSPQPTCQSINVRVNEVNASPTLEAISAQSIDEGQPLSFTAHGSDTDVPPNSLQYSLAAGSPAGAAINLSTGAFTWTPSEAQGPNEYNLSVCVSDGLISTPVCTPVSITVREVNVPPTLEAISDRSGDEGQPLSFNVVGDDSDLPANPLTYCLKAGFPEGAAINAATGAFTWTPSEAQGPGTYNLEACVSDGSITEPVCDAFTLTIREVNAPPTLDAIPSQTTDEGQPLSFTAHGQDSDVPPNSLRYSLAAGSPTGASIDVASGLFTWTPTEAQGPDVYNFQACVSDGVVTTPVCRPVSVTVREVNVPPTLEAISDQSGDEGQPLSFTARGSDSDLPANPLTYSLKAGFPEGAAVNPSTGAFTWTPSEAQGPGTYNLEACVSDGSITEPVCDAFTLTIREANTPPTLDAIPSQTIDEGLLLSFTTHGQDSDVPPNSLRYSLAAGSPTGASIDAASGLFTWTPTEAQGPDVYNFQACVSDGVVTTPVCRPVSVTVREVNVPPTLEAIPDQSGDEGQPLSFTARGSDSDLPANTLTYSLKAGFPEGAAINASTGAFTWTPSEAQGPGTYNLEACVSDGSITEPVCDAFVLTIREVNTPPALDPIQDQSVNEGNELSFNAVGHDSDIPANLLTYSLGAGSPTGASIDAASGRFTWTPTEAQAPGAYDLQICVNDNATPTLVCVNVHITVNLRTASQTIPLQTGWNLISFYLHPTNTEVSSVLSNLGSSYDLVYAWDASSVSGSHWLKYDPGAEPYANSLHTLDEKMGFWIHMTHAGNLVINGMIPETTTIDVSDNAGGWNLVGYPTNDPGALPAILDENGLAGHYTLVYAYHANDTGDPWKLFDPAAPGYADLTQLTTGWGYWIKVNGDFQWVVINPAD